MYSDLRVRLLSHCKTGLFALNPYEKKVCGTLQAFLSKNTGINVKYFRIIHGLYFPRSYIICIWLPEQYADITVRISKTLIAMTMKRHVVHFPLVMNVEPTLTNLCNLKPLAPHFSMIELRFIRVLCIIFSKNVDTR